MPAAEIENAVSGNILEDDFERKREEMHRVAKDCILVIDNIPKIGPEKYQKLLSKLTQTFSKCGRVRQNDDGTLCITLVQDDEGTTVGFAFVEFVSPEDAHKALLMLHNMQLDRYHRFWACTAGDFERLQSVPDKFVPPPTSEITTNRPNFKSWLLDERGRDQFMIRHGDTTSIFWHDHIIKPQLVSYTPSKLFIFVTMMNQLYSMLMQNLLPGSQMPWYYMSITQRLFLSAFFYSVPVFVKGSSNIRKYRIV